MNEYEFTLKFRLPDAQADPEQFLDALDEAGCDDAAIGIGQPGRVALDFTREARTAFEASPDFVGLTDVADIAGFTRQNMRKLMVSHVATFPVAIHEGTPSLWHLATVLSWLQENQKRPVDGVLLEVARTNMSLNIAKEARQLPGAALPKELAGLFA